MAASTIGLLVDSKAIARLVRVGDRQTNRRTDKPKHIAISGLTL